MSSVETVRDLIERARELGYRDVSDTMDLMASRGDPFDVLAEEQPVSGDRAVTYRAGVMAGVDIEIDEPTAEGAADREKYGRSLRGRGNRRVADAYEYVREYPEHVKSDDFDPHELPLLGEEAVVFSLGLSFGIAHERAGKS